MVGQTLIALCIFTAGLRVQSVPTSAPLPVSLPAKITAPTTAVWTSSAQSTAATTASPASSTHNASVLPILPVTPTSLLPGNISTEPEEITSPVSNWEGTSTDPSPGLSSTSAGVHLTHAPEGHSSGGPEVSTPAAGSQPPTLIYPPAPASSPPPLLTSAPEVSSATFTSQDSSMVTSTQPTGAPTTRESPAKEPSSGYTPTSPATIEPMPKEKTPQDTEPSVVNYESETTTPFLIMQEVEHALSSGSIAAITVTVIAVVLLVFGVAAYLKIRHSSYGRLLDDHDYGSWGNYNNPLYDDS